MYPGNQYMDPYYSHYRNHAPYPYYPPPGCWEAGHARVAMDSSCRPPSYGPWLYNYGMSHLYPPEFHSCGNHTYYPGHYSFRPSFPQEIPPLHLYYNGLFPHHLNAYPSYFVPPPPYPDDQKTYDYDKARSHCCGCPNHVCHGGEKNNMKIEEESPDSEQKDAKNSGLVRHPIYENPVIWLPSCSMKDGENKRRMDLPPQFFNRWALMSDKRTGDVKQHVKDDQKVKQFQWPIFWMPAGYDEKRQEEEEKEMDGSPKVSEEAPPSPNIRIIPLPCLENGHSDQKPATKDESHPKERSTVQKQYASADHQDGRAMETIPLILKKQGEEKRPIRNENDENKPAGGSYRTIPVMTVKESNDKKPDVCVQKDEKKASSSEKEEESGKRSNEGTSKAKPSKLPPVCLRVDPLPRKKFGRGSSRSPSPTTGKDADKAKKDAKETHIKKQETKQSDPKKERVVSEIKEKSPDEMNKGMKSSNETVQAAYVKDKEEEVLTSLDDQKVQATNINFGAQENDGKKNLQGCDKNTEGEIKVQGEPAKDDAMALGIDFSELDAAVLIQSAYRGYYVRRWQPLEKLRKIKNIHEQMQHLKKKLQGLEAFLEQITIKEQVAINETIMNLLLKLDTIQGLHPSVREVRKSVAQELISLQEKLDSLCKQPSGESNHSNGKKEKPEGVEDSFQTTASISAAEASEKEKNARVDEELDLYSNDSKELTRNPVSSVASMDTTQDAGSADQIEQLNTTKKEAHDEGKAATQLECQGALSMNVMSGTYLLEHSTKNNQIEESNTISSEESCEEKDALLVREQEAPSRDFMKPLHDTALSVDSNEAQQYTSSERSNTVISPATTENSTITVVTTSVQSGVAADTDGPVEPQVPRAATVESSDLERGVVPAEEDQCKEPSAPVAALEDSSVSLKTEKPQEHGPAPSVYSGISNPAEQPEEARGVKLQQKVADADSTQDATEKYNGTLEAAMAGINNDDYATSLDTENYVQSPLRQTTSDLQSTFELDVLEESEVAKQCEVSRENDSVLVGKQNERRENQTGDSGNAEDPTLVAVGMEADICESGSREMTEHILPEMERSELSCEKVGVTGHEDYKMYASSKCQTDVHKESCCDDSCCVDAPVPKEVECNEMGADNPKDVSVQTKNMTSEEASLASATPDEGMKDKNKVPEETDNSKEDVSVKIENMTSAEASLASATPGDGMKDENKVPEEASPDYVTCDSSMNDNENKLAKENQKLKEMLQKLLASGSDQMGVITELSEKVRTLDRAEASAQEEAKGKGTQTKEASNSQRPLKMISEF